VTHFPIIRRNGFCYGTTIFFTLLAAILLVPVQAMSQWLSDSTINNPVCTMVNDQTNLSMVSDSSGGGIVVWQDMRNGTYGIYAQRLCFCDEVVDWAANGVVICSANNNQTLPLIVKDHRSGAIIAWQDERAGASTLYAQKVNAHGAIQWAVNGVALCSADSSHTHSAIVSDETGGAIIVWQDRRNGNDDIYTQRVDSNGAVLWGAHGLPICVQDSGQCFPQIVGDGSGGAIITWQDKRAGDFDIYAQRVNSGGVVRWSPANGKAVATMPGDQLKPEIVSDGSHGAIITWYDFRSTTDYNIYAQRVNGNGAQQWTTDGNVMNNNAPNAQTNPQIVSDGGGGAIIAWQDKRNGAVVDIYAQRVNGQGAVLWTSTGTAIGIADSGKTIPAITEDFYGGAYITWSDARRGTPDIYAQRVNTSGGIQWPAGGKAISIVSGCQTNPSIIGDGSGGAIIAWQDFRNGQFDIFAERVTMATGLFEEGPGPKPSMFLTLSPNPFFPGALVNYYVSQTGMVSLKLFNVSGHEIASFINGRQEAGYHTTAILTGNEYQSLSSGAYFCRLVAGDFILTKKMTIVK